MVTVDHSLASAPDSLTRLRVAAAAVSADHDPGGSVELDAGAAADRFEELHDALVAVLADVDRG